MSEVVAECIAPTHVPTTLLETFTPLVAEARIHFNDDGITMRAVDPANVAMHFVELDAAAFESWETPGTVTIAANLEAVVDRLGVAGPDDLAELAVDMETRHLHIDVRNHSMQVALIDPDAVRSEPDTPDIDLPNTAIVPVGELQNALSVAEMVSDHVELRADVDAETVEIFAEGDTDESTTAFDREPTLAGTKITETTASTFSLSYLEKFADPMPTDGEVTMHFGDDFPVVMEWSALDGDMTVESMAAPRIQSE